MHTQSQLIIFDGICNLCHGAVNFVIEHDRDEQFKFASLQSNAGKSNLAKFGVTELALDSVILIKAGKCYLRSEAAVEIAKSLDAPWSLLRLFGFMPVRIRDWFYNALARRRYRLFGTRAICLMPTAAIKKRFIED